MPQTFQVDQMQCTVFDTNQELGNAAAHDFAKILRDEIGARGEISIILATGNAQLTFLPVLRELPNIAWDQVRIFQLDEYIGISADHPASFRRFHQQNLIDYISPLAFYGLGGDAPDVNAELERYTRLLETYPPIACVLGIGENGHLAFNDPPADFETTKAVHVVNLDEACRMQQVGEGYFPSLADVPRQALSMTVYEMLKPPHILGIVPEKRKAQIVKAALEGPVTPNCPASILKTKSNVHLYLDRDSASLLTLPTA